MTLDHKISKATDVIESVLVQYKNPCLLCSFGKDSVLILAMLRKWFKPLPIIFIKQPYYPRKYAYANRLIEEWNLNVFSDVPPHRYAAFDNERGDMELIGLYDYGQKSLMIPIGRVNPEGGINFLCGKDDFLNRPRGNFDWPWDCAISGHKNSDIDPLTGEISLNCDIHQVEGSCHTAFPLRHFTDEDVWKLFEKWNLPIHVEKYEKVDDNGCNVAPVAHSWKVKEDKTYDPEYFPYCNICLNRNNKPFVICPKNNMEITNISANLRYIIPREEVGYIGKNLT